MENFLTRMNTIYPEVTFTYLEVSHPYGDKELCINGERTGCIGYDKGRSNYSERRYIKIVDEILVEVRDVLSKYIK